jgi:hypothetical protein
MPLPRKTGIRYRESGGEWKEYVKVPGEQKGRSIPATMPEELPGLVGKVSPRLLLKPMPPRKTGIRYREPGGEWKEYVKVPGEQKGRSIPAAAPKERFDFGETPEQKARRLESIRQWQAELAEAREIDWRKREQKSRERRMTPLARRRAEQARQAEQAEQEREEQARRWIQGKVRGPELGPRRSIGRATPGIIYGSR